MTTTDSGCRIAVRFEPDWPAEGLPEFARWVEEHGFEELWFSEDLGWSGGLVMAATALAHTRRLRVGLGLVPAASRNVSTLAMEVAALARLAPNRLTIAIGHGVSAWMEKVGARSNTPQAALEETVVALRALLAGERVTTKGRHVRLDDVGLGFPPATIPSVLIGTTGPQGLRAAGRSSDGVVLPEVCTPEAVRWARSTMNSAGAVVVFAMLNISDDARQALAQTRSKLLPILDLGIYPRMTEIAGLSEGGNTLTDAMVQSMAAAGTPADCARAIRDWADAGADCVVLIAGGPDPRAIYERLARDVLPLVPTVA
ncbi:MAG: LLM class flavin-dependent oxidoreductase [Mycobacterium sp.]